MVYLPFGTLSYTCMPVYKLAVYKMLFLYMICVYCFINSLTKENNSSLFGMFKKGFRHN